MSIFDQRPFFILAELFGCPLSIRWTSLRIVVMSARELFHQLTGSPHFVTPDTKVKMSHNVPNCPEDTEISYERFILASYPAKAVFNASNPP